MSSESPDAVRAVIEQQIRYLGDQVHRIDGDHASIRESIDDVSRGLDDVHATLRGLDAHLRAMLEDPPRLERHWAYGQGIFLAKWTDAAARAVGNRVLTFIFAAVLAGLLTWAVLRGGVGK